MYNTSFKLQSIIWAGRDFCSWLLNVHFITSAWKIHFFLYDWVICEYRKLPLFLLEINVNSFCSITLFFYGPICFNFFPPLICHQHFDYKVTGHDFLYLFCLWLAPFLGLWVYICFLLFSHLKLGCLLPTSSSSMADRAILSPTPD